jgi:hypothetical protein
MTITISPYENSELAAWAFNSDGFDFESQEKWQNRNVYVAAYFAGSNIFTPYFFTVDIDVSRLSVCLKVFIVHFISFIISVLLVVQHHCPLTLVYPDTIRIKQKTEHRNS